MLATLTPRNLFRAALDFGMASAQALEKAAPEGASRLRWAELHNRLHAYKLFQYADRTLGVGESAPVALPELIGRTLPLCEADRVWTAEGASYYWSEACSSAGYKPALSREAAPEWATIPLHAGLGLFVATRRLGGARSGDAVAEALASDVAASAMPGFERVAFESAGLVARTLHPHLLPALDRALSANDRVLRACLWHGFGRGSYFAPSNWTQGPASFRCAADAIARAAPDATAKRNAMAGLIWAVNLVNLRSPEVLAAVVACLPRDCDPEAFANGIMSSLAVWKHAAPGDPAMGRLIEYQPTDPKERDAWETLVRRPAELSRQAFPRLRAEEKLQDVFHFQI
jgi:hypothetical protein